MHTKQKSRDKSNKKLRFSLFVCFLPLRDDIADFVSVVSEILHILKTKQLGNKDIFCFT